MNNSYPRLSYLVCLLLFAFSTGAYGQDKPPVIDAQLRQRLVDNIVRPLVVTGRAQISTLPVLLGLMGGLATFGAIGIVLGPVVIALALALLRFIEEERPV